MTGRWEWRAFGDGLEGAEGRLTALAPESVQESDEVYIVSLVSDASVKVRDGRLDAKRLLAVDADGLEQWLPVVKAAFPLEAEDLATVFELLGVAAVSGGAASVDALLALVAADPDLLAVGVHKHREHYTLAGCMVERSQFSTDAGSVRTIAIEADEVGHVRALVRELRLKSLPVTCVARGLKSLMRFAGRRSAVIDVGTNSVKFHVGEQSGDGTWRTLVDRAEVTRLGEGQAAGGELSGPAIERTATAIAGMAAQARRLGAAEIAVVGTAGLRIAPNAGELIGDARARAGVEVEILPAQEEARLAFAAATHELELPGGALAVFDTGGGSSQFTFVSEGRVGERFSVNVGAVRFTERFGLEGMTSPTAVQAALLAIESELVALASRPRPDAVIGMGGAVTNLAAVQQSLAVYDPAAIHGTVLTRTEVERQLQLYSIRSTPLRRRIVGLQPNRAEVILAGACIVRTVLMLLGADSMIVSDRGLRHGLLTERFGRVPAAAG